MKKIIDSKGYEIIVNGFPLANFGEDTVELTFEDDQNINIKTGVRGEECVTQNNNGAGQLKFTILQNGTKELIFLTELKETGAFFPVLFKDFSSGSPVTVEATEAIFKNKFAVKRSGEPEDTEIIIHMPDCKPQYI